ncbi:telomere repeat-binding factor 1 [Medicago truncatula]|nr:telomere repeat-binding factor 1 [Medicago truncatula]
MGATRQKWSSEEEVALKAGVVKHGVGKWSKILKDPEFNHVLYIRSNIDLKDKWRNMSLKANGSSSGDNSQLAIKRVRHQAPEQRDNSMAVNLVTTIDDEILDVQPLQVKTDMLEIKGPERSIKRLDNLIMEAISSLNEVDGSNKTTIASFIKNQYCAPADFKNKLSAKLVDLVSSGKLIKVKHRYMIAPTQAYSDRGGYPPMLLLEGRQKASIKSDRDGGNIPTKSDIDYQKRKAEIDLELEKLKSMSLQEVIACAAQAVAEAEAAMAEAEEATKEAEAAEAEADAAAAIAKAAEKSLR